MRTSPDGEVILPRVNVHPALSGDTPRSFERKMNLVTDAASRLAGFLDNGDESAISRELSPESSSFLRTLKMFLKVDHCPAVWPQLAMGNLKSKLSGLRAAFVKRYKPGKAKVVSGEIDRLVREICDSRSLADKSLCGGVYCNLCVSFKALNSDSDQEKARRRSTSMDKSDTHAIVEIGDKSVLAIGKAVAKNMTPGRRRKHALPETAVRARDSRRDKKADDTKKVVAEVNRRWRKGGGSRREIIDKMRREEKWSPMMHQSSGTIERYAKGYRG